MSRRKATAVLKLGVVCLLALLIASCSSRNPLVGKWRSQGPAQLLFEYRSDGTVRLLADTGTYQVFRYKIFDRQSLQLFDGMGRIREYNFQVTGDTLTYFDKAAPEVVREQFRKEE